MHSAAACINCACLTFKTVKTPQESQPAPSTDGPTCFGMAAACGGKAEDEDRGIRSCASMFGLGWLGCLVVGGLLCVCVDMYACMCIIKRGGERARGGGRDVWGGVGRRRRPQQRHTQSAQHDRLD